MGKWSEDITVKFVTIYLENECLWNPNNPIYKMKHAREVAYQKIMKEMGIMDFGVKEIKSKIKSIRSTYIQELKKVYDSHKSGAGSDLHYRPNIKWFTIMYEALKAANVEFKISQDNVLDLSGMKPDNSQTTESTMQYEIPHNDIPPRLPKKRPMTKELNSLIDKVRIISQELNEGGTNENEFQIFGRSVGVQLNALPIEIALQAQEFIQSYITKLRLQQVQSMRPVSSRSEFYMESPSPQQTPSVSSPECSLMLSPEVTLEEQSTYLDPRCKRPRLSIKDHSYTSSP